MTSYGCTGCSSSILLSIDGPTTKGLCSWRASGVCEGTRHIVGIGMTGESMRGQIPNLGYERPPPSNTDHIYPISDKVLHIRGQRFSHQPRSNPFKLSRAIPLPSPRRVVLELRIPIMATAKRAQDPGVQVFRLPSVGSSLGDRTFRYIARVYPLERPHFNGSATVTKTFTPSPPSLTTDYI